MIKQLFILFNVVWIGACVNPKTKTEQRTPQQKVNLTDSLEIYCPFDTGANDFTKNAYHGTLVGATILDSGIVGKGCVTFDGVDDFLKFPSHPVYFFSDYSISIWCNFAKGKEWMRILDFNQTQPASGPCHTFLLGRSENGKNCLWYDQWVVTDTDTVESILQFLNPDAYLRFDVDTNRWYHFVLVYNSKAPNSLKHQKNSKGKTVPLSGQVTLYVDGVKIHTTPYCLKPQEKPTPNNWLGRSAYVADPFFKGKMDDFRIYSRCLKEDEIMALYKLKNNLNE